MIVADNKNNNIAERLILFGAFIVFAGIVVTFAYRWNYVDEDDTYSAKVTSFQYATSSKTDFAGTASKEESNSSATVTGKVNINTATLEELDTLPGIGEAKARAIIEYRENESTFLKPEDIMNVSGIGEKTYENLKDYIIVK